MFHSRTTDNNKDLLLKSLTIPDGKVRIVFATSALGMGIHMTSIRLSTMEHLAIELLQSSGRGGRSGSEARSIVFWIPHDFNPKQGIKSTKLFLFAAEVLRPVSKSNVSSSTLL